MDEESKLLFAAMAETQDALTVRLAALTAIVGALTENQKPDPDRVDAWCFAIATHSDQEHGVSASEVQRMARDLLVGIDAKKMN